MRYFKITLLAALFFFLLASMISAGTRDPNIADAHYVSYGKKFPFVGRLRAVNAAQEREYSSVVLIRPHWALAAAHATAATSAHTVLLEDDTESYPAEYVLTHKEFNPKLPGNHHDIALIYSPRDFAREFYTPLYTDKDEVGKVATLAGFGLHGTFETGSRLVDTQRRAGSNLVERAEDSILICTPSSGAHDKKTGLEFFIAPGDSGGGLFIGNKLAGIHSFVSVRGRLAESKYGEISGHTRVSLYVDWVESEINKYEETRAKK